MPTFFQIRAFLSYWLEAVDRHSLHSPFFYDLWNNVLRAKKYPDSFKQIENLRKKLLHDNRKIKVQDFGSGSDTLNDQARVISGIAKSSLTQKKFSLLYYKLIEYFNARNILELGTSLGINTLYLAHSQKTQVTTFEGSPEISAIAQLTFEFGGHKNIKLIEGNINSTLPQFLQSSGKLDLAFIDANHRYEPTKKYFELIIQKTHPDSVVIIDDIHRSKEMQKAWNDIQKNKLVYASIDLFTCGLVFFDPSLNNQHVIMQF